MLTLKSMKKVSSGKLNHQSLRIFENNICSSVLWQSSNSCGFSQTTLLMLPSVLIFLWILALQSPLVISIDLWGLAAEKILEDPQRDLTAVISNPRVCRTDEQVEEKEYKWYKSIQGQDRLGGRALWKGQGSTCSNSFSQQHVVPLFHKTQVHCTMFMTCWLVSLQRACLAGPQFVLYKSCKQHTRFGSKAFLCGLTC